LVIKKKIYIGTIMHPCKWLAESKNNYIHRGI